VNLDDFLNRLKYACDIEDVVSSYVTLKRAGRHKSGLCPFHLEKTPSFVVYPDTQSFFCFGCGVGGDVISFVMKHENLDYMEALRFLSARSGIPMPEDSRDSGMAEIKKRIYEANKKAARFFYKQLGEDCGRYARKYAAGRGLTPETVRKFGIGYAPDGWDGLKDHMLSEKFTLEELAAADLIVRGKNGGYYDRFRNRLIFPIIDLRGNVIAFSGRALDDKGAKYLNSSDTPVFKKSHNLFALNFAKSAGSRRLVLAEGNMDAVSMWQAGVTEAIAACGTAFTAEQAKLVSRYADSVVIAYDSDIAGQKATERATSLLSQAGVEASVLILNADDPDIKDPDDYIRKYGALRFRDCLEKSKPVQSYKFSTLKNKYDLSLPEEKIKYIHGCVEALAEIYDDIERDVYISNIAADTGISKEVLQNSTSDLIKKRAKGRKQKQWRDTLSGREIYGDRLNPSKADNLKASMSEEGIIWFILGNPDYREYILSKIKSEDFVSEWSKRVFFLIMDKLKDNRAIDFTAFSSELSPEEMSRLAGIMAKKTEFSNTKKQLDDYIDVLLSNKNKKGDTELEQMSPEDIKNYMINKRKKQGEQ